jgi:hypothetical protein
MAVGELAFALAEPGEIEPQGGDALRRERGADAPRAMARLGAGEAMREQSDGADPPRRQFERSRERHARRILEPNLTRHPRLHYRWSAGL